MTQCDVDVVFIARALQSLVQRVVISDVRSSIIFLRFQDPFPRYSLIDEEELYARIAQKCLEGGLMIVSTEHVKPLLHITPPPSIRITITAAHSQQDSSLDDNTVLHAPSHRTQ